MKLIQVISLAAVATAAQAQIPTEYYDYTGSLMAGNGATGTLSVAMTILGPVTAPDLVGYTINYAGSNFSQSIDASNCTVGGGCGGLYGHSGFALNTIGNSLSSAYLTFNSVNPNSGETTSLSIGPKGDSFSYSEGTQGGSLPNVNVSDMVSGTWVDPSMGRFQAPEVNASGAPAALTLLGCCVAILAAKRRRA